VSRRHSGRGTHLSLLALCVLVAGCGLAASASLPPSAPAQPPSSPVEGVITHVESTGLNQVTSFTLRTAGGAIYQFELEKLENGDEFPPGHLTEHQAISEPIRVYFTVLGRMAFATRIEDAGD
jgi:hypothetical protein